MTDAALDDPVRIFAREFLGVGIGIRVWCTVGVTFKGNGGHGDTGPSQAAFRRVIFRLAFSRAEPRAVVIDYYGDMVRKKSLTNNTYVRIIFSWANFHIVKPFLKPASR
jgi:hypothetical protein